MYYDDSLGEDIFLLFVNLKELETGQVYRLIICNSPHHYVTNLDFVGILFSVHPDLP